MSNCKCMAPKLQPCSRSGAICKCGNTAYQYEHVQLDVNKFACKCGRMIKCEFQCVRGCGSVKCAYCEMTYTSTGVPGHSPNCK